MNKLNYDLIILAVTILVCFIYNLVLYRRAAYSSKKGFTWLLIFLAMYPMLNILAHLIAVSIVAGIKVQAGAFVYDMKFYTLIQFGVLLLLINGYQLNRINEISRGNWGVYRQIMLASVLQSAIVLPLIPFNPLSALPVMTSIVLILRLAVARRGRESASVAPVMPAIETVPSLV